MKQTIGIFILALISVPQILLADMGNMNQGFPGFSSPFKGYPSHLTPPRQNMRPPMPPMQQRPVYQQRAQAPRWNARPPMMPARQAMRPPMPRMQQRPVYPQRAQAPRWNARPPMMPARQAMRPLMPRMQQRPVYPQRAQAPRWNARPPMMPARQAMRPPMPRMQQRPVYPQRAQAPRWNARPPMMPAFNRWSQGHSQRPAVSYKSARSSVMPSQYNRFGQSRVAQPGLMQASRAQVLPSRWNTPANVRYPMSNRGPRQAWNTMQYQRPAGYLPVSKAAYMR